MHPSVLLFMAQFHSGAAENGDATGVHTQDAEAVVYDVKYSRAAPAGPELDKQVGDTPLMRS